MKLDLCSEEIHLLADKAFYWPRQDLLAFSDVHIGKAESLQKLGIPIPSGSHLEDLEKMESLIQQTKPKQVFILGDLIHQKNSWAPHIINDLKTFFIRHQKIEWNLVIGNHEKGSINHLIELPIKLIEDSIIIEPFCLTHGHIKNSTKHTFEIRGHLHPVIRIKEGPIQLRLPCFLIERASMTLPSFGVLAGGYEIHKSSKNQIIAIAGKTLIEIQK